MTDFAQTANRALDFTKKSKKAKKSKQKKGCDVNEANINPTNFETRYGVLPPWGGAWGSGASTPIEHEPQVIDEDD